MARALACCCVTREALAASTQSHQQTTQHRVPKSLPGMKMLEPIEQGALVYKPYLDYLCFQLLDSAPDVQALPLDDQLAFKSSPRKANVYNWLYSSRRLRRIRITYFDAGRACQALNALLYPDNSFDLPLLGIDLLSFGANKILCVVDFIPLFQDQGYLEKYIRPLALLRQPFAARCSEMSDRFFDKDKFASEQMIFFRSDQGSLEPDLEVSSGGMYRVYTQYVATYLKSLHSLEPNEDPGFCVRCHEKQAAYDRYLADRDPAFKVFSSYFGSEWTQKFCYKFLSPGISIPCHKAKQRQ